MTLLKHDGYTGLNIITGDDEFDAAQKDHLKLTVGELVTAINSEHVTDTLFKRIIKQRSEAYRALAGKLGERD